MGADCPAKLAGAAGRCALCLAVGFGLTVALVVISSFRPRPDTDCVQVITLAKEGSHTATVGGMCSNWGLTRMAWNEDLFEEIQESHGNRESRDAYAGVVMRVGVTTVVNGKADAVPRLPAWSEEASRLLQDVARTKTGERFPQRREHTEIACGWPWRAFYAQWEYSRIAKTNTFNVVNLKHGLLGPGRSVDRVVLPYKPIWTGLMGDTAVLGAAAAGVAGAVKCSVRALRRRRGKCEGCGYEVKGLGVCPECGRGCD